MPRVVHFEIHAADPEGVARFSQELFGWRIARRRMSYDETLAVRVRSRRAARATGRDRPVKKAGPGDGRAKR